MRVTSSLSPKKPHTAAASQATAPSKWWIASPRIHFISVRCHVARQGYKPRADTRMRPDGPTRFVKRLPSLKIYLIYRPFCQLHIRPVVLAPEPLFGGNIINLHPQYTSFCLTYVKSLDELYKEECVCSPYSSRLRDMFPAFWLTHL